MIFLCGLFNGMEYIYAVNNAQTTKLEVEVRFQFHLSSVDCARAGVWIGGELRVNNCVAHVLTFASADRMPPSPAGPLLAGRPLTDRSSLANLRTAGGHSPMASRLARIQGQC